ncbi:ATPase YjeE [Candidatus Nitrosoglobus terrae]|uniref:tRNA threonylcarbamoyladenosine biosynthesis protein TsaE n=1 Tax=Candidatus Nitrosoglobus terrae TaxID=1630141 RepID=A0A1Q2SKC4_9GAMM|nr:tRNA (adenosine(37)-N6)-threonylcarbamoyltransferase complex ATPase subunit type 1 TsaE [Candidatus Nitrosoglobus terrae]BAW79570.1 ATPase YjeE [Candidatus Nitrosoglobus terrae]
MHKIILANEGATLNLGTHLAQASQENTIIFLTGTLGAGKTTLVRGFLRAFGHQGVVKSPTYTLVETYIFNQKQLYHFDFYRLAAPQELEFIGLQDYFTSDSICLVEWPEHGESLLPPPDLYISLEYAVNNSRSACLQANTKKGETLLQSILESR